MKYCPTCEIRYDEEVLRFCTKDGTPLIDEEKPNFVAMPSESLEEQEDDPGEITVIRRNPSPPPSPDANETPVEPSERIVIPTSEQPREQQVRPRNYPSYYPPPPPESNTLKVVVLTVFGTIAVLALGSGAFWMLQSETPANVNTNLNANLNNINTNLNTNLNLDTNFNFNVNGNFNTNINANANVKSPTPTPTRSPSPSPSATPDETPTPSPTRSPTPRSSPTASPRSTPRPTPRIVGSPNN